MQRIAGSMLGRLALAALILQSESIWAAHPIVVYSQWLPVEPSTFVSGLAVDPSGAAYLVRGHYYGGGADVSRVDTSGHVWTVRIGGDLDEASAVATDALGNVYVVGNTQSPDFPTMNAVQARLGGGRDQPGVGQPHPAARGDGF